MFRQLPFKPTREKDITPHCILFYGAKLGISDSYEYKISDQYESIRNQKWFWNGLHRKNAEIRMDLDNGCDYNKYKYILQNPFKKNELDDNFVEEIDNKFLIIDAEEKIEDYNFNNIEKIADADVLTVNKKTNSVDTAYDDDEERDGNTDTNTDADADADTDTDTDAADIEITLISKNIPVITILQEAHEGTLDSLLDLEEIDGIEYQSPEWDILWLAWIFQIVACLSVLQKVFLFTHNDLHSNNIVWRKTDAPYLFYRSKSGTVWKIPTYGRIFSIIDFGRAIYEFKNEILINTYYWILS